MSGKGIATITPRPATLPEKIEYARQLAESGLLPTQYRKNPANVLYACEYGEMLGLSPMAAITGVWIIEGKPSASAALISALVRSAGHRLRVTGDNQRAVAEITRSDDPDFTFRVEWTMERARLAGLLGKDIWKKYGPNMLKHRAVSECANDACEEVLFGLLTPEELGVDVDQDGVPLRPVQVVATRLLPEDKEPDAEPKWDELLANAERDFDLDELKRIWDLAKGMRPNDAELLNQIAETVHRVRAGATPTPEPAEPAATEQPESPPERKQKDRLFALLRDGGVAGTDRAVRLRIVNRILADANRAPATPVTSFDHLGATDLEVINTFLQDHKTAGDLVHTMADLGSDQLPLTGN